MRKMSFFFLNALLCICLLTVTSCTPAGSQSSSSDSPEAARASRPVTKRLCALVIIGNLGNVEFDMAMAGFATESPVYSAMTPSMEKREKSVMSSLLDLDNEETEAELNELIRQQRKLLESDMPSSTNAPDTKLPSRSMSTTTSGEDDAIEAPPTGMELNIPSLTLEGLTPEGLTPATPARASLTPETDTDEEYTLGNIPMDDIELDDDEYLPEEAVAEALSRSIKQSIGETVKVEEEAPKKPAAPVLTEEELNSLRDEHVKKFLEMNKNVPENVLKEISDNNFQNYSIWFGQSNTGVFYAVRYVEYVGAEFDFEKDYFMLYTSPGYKAWMEQQQEYLRPTGSSSFMIMDVWLEMKELFHTTSL